MTEISTKKPTRKEKRNAPRRVGPPDSPEVRAEILRLMRSGCTITEICARDDMPPSATFFYWRAHDEAFAAECIAAMNDHVEYLISDAMEQSVAATDDIVDAVQGDSEPVNPAHKPDPARAKAADLYLQAALRYAGAIAPAKYGSLVKLADAQIGNGVQISITSYATNGSSDGAASPEDTAKS